MPRSKNKVASRTRRKKVLKLAKGNYGRRKNVWTVAKNAVEKGLTYAFIGRKLKKRDYRSMWIVRINAAARLHDLSYSRFMNGLKLAGVEVNRKILADLAIRDPNAFAQLAETAKSRLN